MKHVTLHDENGVRWIVFGRDPEKSDQIVDTNEFLIISGGEAILLDPGGVEIFPSVLTSVSQEIDLRQIKAYLCSHQDPDIMSSLPLWLGLTPDAKIYLSWLWGGFVSHFGHQYAKNFHLLPDEGETMTLGGLPFQFVPAHHCHSAGNFNFYDPRAGILFSGDMGAALLPDDVGLFVEDFGRHIGYMEKFHRRWMPSNEAKNAWVSRVRKLNPKMICPQHGAIFRDRHVADFLDWIEDLDVGHTKKFAA